MERARGDILLKIYAKKRLWEREKKKSATKNILSVIIWNDMQAERNKLITKFIVISIGCTMW